MSRRRGIPKHARLATEVRRLIRRKRLRVGDALPTEQELSREFECSRGTVRRALDTLVNEGLIRRRQGAGHFVAREAGRRESLIGLVVPNILNAEILRIAQGLTLKAGKRGYRVILCVTNEQPPIEREFIRELHRLKAAGVIRFPTIPEVPGFEPGVREMMRGLGLRYVIVNDFWTDTSRDHHVAFDEAAAIEAAVEHLVELGHRRIGWADGSDGPRRRALECLKRCLERHGLDLPEDRVFMYPPYEAPPLQDIWPEDSPPTAVITPYDGMAVRLIEALPKIGLRVPEDVSIVNLNGPPFYMNAGLELTTALPPNERIISKALELITEQTYGDAVRQYLFRPGFSVGGTTAPPHSRPHPNAGAGDAPVHERSTRC